MDMKFKETERFIELVAEHPSLYDPRNTNYKDQFLRDSIWAGISQQMNNNSIEECKKCWRNLKDSYKRFKRRFEETGQVDKRSNYRIYELLTFLDDVLKQSHVRRQQTCTWTAKLPPRDATDRIIPKFDSGDPVVVGIEHSVFDKPIQVLKTRKVVKVKKAKPFSSQQIVAEPSPKPVLRHAKTIKLFPLKRRRVEEISNETDVPNAVHSGDSNGDDKNLEEDNTLALFATHVKEILKKLPPLLQIQAKQEIFGIATKYELLALEASNVSESSNMLTTEVKIENNDDDADESSSIDLEIVKQEPNITD